MKMLDLRVLVTGGASGIGLATARLFSQQGAAVAVLDREPIGDVTTSRLPIGTTYVRADVAERTAVAAAVDEAALRLGGLDVLVNNVGIGAQGDVEANDDDEWFHILDINVVGLVRVVRAALPALRRSNQASIVNTCSIAATIGLPNRVLYSASKGAVLALTRAMAADLLSEGIRVNAVSPGTADTPWVERLVAASEDPVGARKALEARQPHGRLVSAEEVAHAIAYLAAPTSGSTTGEVIAVDGGMSGLRPSRTPG